MFSFRKLIHSRKICQNPYRLFAAKFSNNMSILEKGTILSKLENRSVISVRGPDASDLLQNLMTQDINLFEKEGPNRAAISTAFLNAKGKVLMDGIVVKPRLAG